MTKRSFADTDWVDHLTGPMPLDRPATPPKSRDREKFTIFDSSLDLAAGAEAQEIELTSSMMGLFD